MDIYRCLMTMNFMKLTSLLTLTALMSGTHQLLAQESRNLDDVTVRTMARTHRDRIADNAIIYDSTGRRMTLAEFAALNRSDPQRHRLIPVFDEYGKPGHYLYRPATKEELETGHRTGRNAALTPKPGEKMPPFVMQGTDGKTYRLADLAGKKVLLSFWVSFQPPFAPPNYVQTLANVLKTFRQRSDIVALGITEDSPDRISGLLGTQEVPFVPVGNGRGFMERYHIFTSPTLFVIDQTGTVVAKLDGVNAEELEAALKKLN